VPFDLLLDPLRFPFMRFGLLEVVLFGVACGLIGPFVVQRKLTFFGHALSHTIFPALVVAAALHVHLLWAASLGAALTVLLVFSLRRQHSIGEDSAVGTVFVGLFALGVVLVGWLRVRAPDLGAAMVGNLLGIGLPELVASSVLCLMLAGTIGVLYRPLVLVSFDRLAAQALALPVALLDLLLLTAVAATAVVSVKVVGVILTVALLVVPAAAARLWSAHLPRVMLLAACFCIVAGASGLYAAYFASIAPAAVVVLMLGALFGLSVILAPRRRALS
jgi:manganese/iron transport system permease protein